MNHIKYFLFFFLILLNSCSKDEKEISYIKESSQDLEMVAAYKEAYQALEEIGVKPNVWYKVKVRNEENLALNKLQSKKKAHHGSHNNEHH